MKGEPAFRKTGEGPPKLPGEKERSDAHAGSGVIQDASLYIARSGQAELPPEVVVKAKHHILDTLGAVVSGSRMKPGELAIKYIKSQAGVKQALVIGSSMVTTAGHAAFANGMMAHADETDDSHEPSGTHPGCAIVPAALAVAEAQKADGMRFLKAVIAGYDIGCRMNLALGVDNLVKKGRSTHSVGGHFGAAAAAAALLRLSENQVAHVLSYIANQAAGARHYVREQEHVEKAFVYGGLPAQNGVLAAFLVHAGFPGVSDIFTGNRNFLESYLPEAQPRKLVDGLGRRFEIVSTNIKKFAVGSPIQAPADALILLIKKHHLEAADVQDITVRFVSLPTVVMDRDLPDINLQYNLAVTLLDGGLSFAASHNHGRMQDPDVLEIKKRICVEIDPGLRKIADTGRQAVVEVTTKGGAKFSEHVFRVRGTAQNPLSSEEVEKKCTELMAPVLGSERTERLIENIRHLENVRNVRALRPLLAEL